MVMMAHLHAGEWHMSEGRQRISGVVLALVFLGAGLLFVGIVIVDMRAVQTFVAQAQTGSGEVIRLEEVSSGDTSPDTYRPVVRYTTSDARVYEFTEPQSEYPARFRVGEQVNLLYNPSNPNDARVTVYTELGSNTLWLMGLGIGGAVALFGVLFLFRALFGRIPPPEAA